VPFFNGDFSEYELKAAYAGAGLSQQPRIGPISYGDMKEHGADLSADLKEFALTLALIKRLGILTENVINESIDLADIAAQVKRNQLPSKLDLESKTTYTFTQLGTQFMNACQKPAKPS
jgi:hypothetical protein